MTKLDAHVFDMYEVNVSAEDKSIILNHFQNEIELSLDYYNRVWNEGGQYIADLELLEATYC